MQRKKSNRQSVLFILFIYSFIMSTTTTSSLSWSPLSPSPSAIAPIATSWSFYSNTDCTLVHGFNDGTIYYFDGQQQIHRIQPRRLLRLLRRALHWPSEDELQRRRRQRQRRQQQQQQQQQRTQRQQQQRTQQQHQQQEEEEEPANQIR